MKRLMTALILVLGLGLTTAGVAGATSPAELEARIKALEQSLKQLKGQLEQVRQQQQQDQAAVAAASKAKLPAWAERMTFFGDLRLRYEHTSYDDTIINGKNTVKNGLDRFRLRLRFGVRSQIHEDVELGMRMTAGSDSDPSSTNQTMGNYFGEITTWGVDQAYLKWTPSLVPAKAATFSFGKVPQPLLTSKVIWDTDVVPEGGFLTWTFNKGGQVQPFITGAMLTVQQSGEFNDNILAPVLQAGARGKLGAWRFEGAAGYTDWNKLGDPGLVPPSPHGNPIWTSGGATRMSSFKVWDVYAKASFAFSPQGNVGLWGHYLRNTDATGPYDGKDTGYGVAAFVNYGKWKFEVWYKNIEANATPGFIADSDSTYVNRKGWSVDVQYKMWQYGRLQLTYYNTEPEDASISGATNKSQTFFVNTIFQF